MPSLATTGVYLRFSQVGYLAHHVSSQFQQMSLQGYQLSAVSISLETIFVECLAFRVAKEVLVTSANLLHLMDDELGVCLNSIDSLAQSSKYLCDFMSSDGITSMRAYLDKENVEHRSVTVKKKTTKKERIHEEES